MLFAREIAARQNLAVRLHRDRIDRRIRVRIEESAAPVVASSRAMRLRVCPPMLFAVEKPPTKILPSA